MLDDTQPHDAAHLRAVTGRRSGRRLDDARLHLRILSRLDGEGQRERLARVYGHRDIRIHRQIDQRHGHHALCVEPLPRGRGRRDRRLRERSERRADGRRILRQRDRQTNAFANVAALLEGVHVKPLFLRDERVARYAVQVFEQLLFLLHAAAQSNAHLRLHAQRPAFVVRHRVRHHVDGLRLRVNLRPIGDLRVDAQLKGQLVAGHHQRIARLLRPVQHAHLHRAADADAPRAARQLRHGGLPRRAEHVADLQPRGQIKFLAHQRFLFAQRRRPAEGDALHPGSERVRVARRVGHERLTGRFKRLDLKIEQRAQGHAAARRRPLRLLHGDACVHPHIRLKLRRVDAVLKVARRLHRTDSRQIPLRIQRLKAHVPA